MICSVRSLSAQTIVDTDSFNQYKDTIATKSVSKVNSDINQFRMSVDIYHGVRSFVDPNYSLFEIQADYNTSEKNYWILEAGFGHGEVDYEFLKYTSNAFFSRIGIDRSFLDLKTARDLDIAYIGVRYSAAYGLRSDATIIIGSPFGGMKTETIPGEHFFVHWGEITAGMKLEIVNRIFLGWNGRAKFLFNGSRFKEIAPNYIAGYGRGDKSTQVDINLYLGFALFRH